MIVITGAAGFIGSQMVNHLNESGFTDLILVDDFKPIEKKVNWQDKQYLKTIDRKIFYKNIFYYSGIHAIIHLGARTDTTETNPEIFQELNLDYSKKLWEYSAQHQIPFLYASSAATYGDGTLGFSDQHNDTVKATPLNEYGISKNEFDKWALSQGSAPPHWYGFKFFNVFGPNEYHKGRMASVVFHAYKQIVETEKMKLFRSHREDFRDGEQKRDFIYVKDVVRVLGSFLKGKPTSGIYNLGTGKAKTFTDLVEAVFAALGKNPEIEFIDTPEDIRENYQYFTEAQMDKTNSVLAGYEFMSLESAIKDYILNHLNTL